METRWKLSDSAGIKQVKRLESAGKADPCPIAHFAS